jgi:hypothetical protein
MYDKFLNFNFSGMTPFDRIPKLESSQMTPFCKSQSSKTQNGVILEKLKFKINDRGL